MKKAWLVSACLLGVACRYDGRPKGQDGIASLLADRPLVAFCPEVAGGLPTPRPKSERLGHRVISEDGQDVTNAFALGAQRALDLCRTYGIKKALLKEGSPSCGVHRIYDGSFSGQRISGQGMTAEILRGHGIEVVSSDEIFDPPREPPC